MILEARQQTLPAAIIFVKQSNRGYIIFDVPLPRTKYRHPTYIWSHYYWVNTPRYITQNSLSNNISTQMYFKSKTKQYLLWCFNIILWLITLCLRLMSKQYGCNIFNSGTKYLSGVCTWSVVVAHTILYIPGLTILQISSQPGVLVASLPKYLSIQQWITD